MISFNNKGDFSKTLNFLKKTRTIKQSVLRSYALKGVEILSRNTPVDTGRTANSWGYELEEGPNYVSIHWTNSNIQEGVNVAMIIQYGHGTGTGGYVTGIDYINPSLKPVFDALADEVWKEVKGK